MARDNGEKLLAKRFSRHDIVVSSGALAPSTTSKERFEKCITRAGLKDLQETIGYQADLGHGYWGSFYDESRRNKVLAAADQKAMHKALKQ
jgi:hypothetical protein